MQRHYFFALVLPDAVKQALYMEVQKENFPVKRFVHSKDYHLTLAFIGGADEAALQNSCRLAAESVQRLQCFPVALTRFAGFGPVPAPRVLWAGTNEPPALFELQRTVAASCRSAGLSIDEKPFRPHVTAARKWAGAEPAQLPVFLAQPLSFMAGEVALYEIHPSRTPKYSKNWSCLLRSSGDETIHGAIN